jgi:phenylalanyl-tRNA synthetase alpha chain
MNIDNILQDFLSEIEKINNLKNLEILQIKYLGRNGKVNQLINQLKLIPVSQKKEFGIKLNNLKKEILEKIDDKKNLLLKKQEEEIIDITLPGKKYPKGSLHPTSIMIDEIIRIFQKIGFSVTSYPEVEWEYFAFEVLNMPKDHPARDDFETFFLDERENKKYGKMLLTPHTSSGQVREMQRVKTPPIRMVNIAKCYRPNWDAVHIPMLHQLEGLCIDKDISVVNLKGTIDYFVKEFLGYERKTRLRPYHFQFTEPSFEVDITCEICKGAGFINNKVCKVCKSGWLELGGAGMVHPYVLKQGGINPDIFSGWAFGFGIERVYMMKEGFMLDDIRILYDQSIEFLEQF